jgi:hypothetical protein
MLDTTLVKEAERAGDLRKVRFYVSHEDRPDREWTIQLNFYEDGHIRSSSEVHPREFDEIVHSISVTKDYSEYLVSLNELIDEIIQDIELEGRRDLFRDRIDTGVEKYVLSKTNITRSDIIEVHMYKMVIANIAIQLYEVAKEMDYDLDPSSTDSWNGKVREFFQSYAQYQITEVGDEEYMFVATRTDQLIDEWKETKDSIESLHGAMGLLETFVDTYDLR